jgi:hypothetical protein
MVVPVRHVHIRLPLNYCRHSGSVAKQKKFHNFTAFLYLTSSSGCQPGIKIDPREMCCGDIYTLELLLVGLNRILALAEMNLEVRIIELS